MGRRYKGVPQEMEDDKGIPGKLYFDKPQVFDISVIRDTVGNKVSTVETGALDGPVRLESTRQLRDFSKRELVHYRMGLRPNLEQINEYIKWAEVQGFAQGAVVARRWCADWRTETVHEWGVIIGCRAYTHGSHEPGFYSPFTVRWFQTRLGEEGVWAEDLYLIHQALSKDLLRSILEEQEPGYQE